MTGFPTANFSDSERGLFSPDEIQQLMRIEFERALRYDYPIALMLVEVDRIEQLHHLYGYESKEEILHAVIGLLRSVTRASDFLGCMVDDRIMVVFPHTPDTAAKALAGRLLQGSRRLDFQSDGRRLRATLSIGMSLLQPGDGMQFEEFIKAAEDSLRFAVDSGGDRFVQREAAVDMIRRLRSDLDSEAEALRKERATREQLEQALAEEQRLAADGQPEPAAPVPAQAAPAFPLIDDLPDEEFSEQIASLFEELGELSPELSGLRERVVTLTKMGLKAARDQAVAEHGSKIDTLERRVTKLMETLEKTEAELLQVARMKGLESGVASIYRAVQGLDAGETDYSRKQEMLTLLFEANVELRKKIKPKA